MDTFKLLWFNTESVVKVNAPLSASSFHVDSMAFTDSVTVLNCINENSECIEKHKPKSSHLARPSFIHTVHLFLFFYFPYFNNNICTFRKNNNICTLLILCSILCFYGKVVVGYPYI